MAAKLLRAKTSFVAAAPKGGVKRHVSEGDLLPADDPIVRRRPALFETPEGHAARVVEAAAKVRRPARRPAKPAPAAPAEEN